jgi:lipopolysaccharide transport system ATP-binding protein
MRDLALCVEGLGKAYRLGGAKPAGSLRDAATGFWRKSEAAKPQPFWALRDVSFQLKRGAALGVVGRNGAGKSTLLKLLSRITEPTEGRAEIRGRVASLLEVGAGFHPELTGRENVFLNAAILGMSRAETRARFDEIVAFAEVERFLETPVKHYSSGMYVRLAFAVAAHLAPDVLIVDEALAVGDAAFQQKCLGRMNALATSQGRTVVFVSHNSKAVMDLCTEALWLEHGEVRARGTPRDVLARYLSEGASAGEWRACRPLAAPFAYARIAVAGPDGGSPQYDEPIAIELEYLVTAALPPGRLAVLITHADGTAVFGSADTDTKAARVRAFAPGRFVARVLAPAGFLAPGAYRLSVSEPRADGGEVVLSDIVTFSVGERGSPTARDGRPGVTAPMLIWETRCEAS